MEAIRKEINDLLQILESGATTFKKIMEQINGWTILLIAMGYSFLRPLDARSLAERVSLQIQSWLLNFIPAQDTKDTARKLIKNLVAKSPYLIKKTMDSYLLLSFLPLLILVTYAQPIWLAFILPALLIILLMIILNAKSAVDKINQQQQLQQQTTIEWRTLPQINTGQARIDGIGDTVLRRSIVLVIVGIVFAIFAMLNSTTDPETIKTINGLRLLISVLVLIIVFIGSKSWIAGLKIQTGLAKGWKWQSFFAPMMTFAIIAVAGATLIITGISVEIAGIAVLILIAYLACSFFGLRKLATTIAIFVIIAYLALQSFQVIAYWDYDSLKGTDEKLVKGKVAKLLSGFNVGQTKDDAETVLNDARATFIAEKGIITRISNRSIAITLQNGDFSSIPANTEFQIWMNESDGEDVPSYKIYIGNKPKGRILIHNIPDDYPSTHYPPKLPENKNGDPDTNSREKTSTIYHYPGKTGDLDSEQITPGENMTDIIIPSQGKIIVKFYSLNKPPSGLHYYSGKKLNSLRFKKISGIWTSQQFGKKSDDGQDHNLVIHYNGSSSTIPPLTPNVRYRTR